MISYLLLRLSPPMFYTSPGPIFGVHFSYKRQSGNVNIDEFVRYEKIKWSETLKANLERGRNAAFDSKKIRVALYRPFTRRHLFYDEVLIERRYQFPQIFPILNNKEENLAVALTALGSER